MLQVVDYLVTFYVAKFKKVKINITLQLRWNHNSKVAATYDYIVHLLQSDRVYCVRRHLPSCVANAMDFNDGQFR